MKIQINAPLKTQRHVLVGVLRAAAHQYNEDALVNRALDGEGNRRVAETFERQALDAMLLADQVELEQCSSIELED